jgi:serine/threonine-protein kinase
MPSHSEHRIRIGQQVGPYRIEGLLGTGGMGQVYVAVDTRLKRTVALKVVGRVAQDQLGLLREARFAAALNHPSICTVYEIGEIEGEPFIVMEHVRGVPLWAAIQQNGSLPLERALSYVMQVADAVAHAHDRGIVHGDLKSSNIMVADDGRIKVLDFGLAVRRNITYAATGDIDTTCVSQSSVAAGTVPYMAPELLRGNLPDVQTDIWALGIVLHEMLTGVRPFQGATPYELAAHILSNQRVPSLATLSAAMWRVLDRCLCATPGSRYASVREFAADLDDLECEPWPVENDVIWPSIQPVATASRTH